VIGFSTGVKVSVLLVPGQMALLLEYD